MQQTVIVSVNLVQVNRLFTDILFKVHFVLFHILFFPKIILILVSV